MLKIGEAVQSLCVGHHEMVVFDPNLRYKDKGPPMKTSVVKHSVVIDGHKTSVSLEDAFWSSLKEIADAQGAKLSALVAEIDKKREQSNLSSAIRLFVLDHVRNGRRTSLIEGGSRRFIGLLLSPADHRGAINVPRDG
jgi:predicted DNA-binding ribbon-helix-helix protein